MAGAGGSDRFTNSDRKKSAASRRSPKRNGGMKSPFDSPKGKLPF